MSIPSTYTILPILVDPLTSRHLRDWSAPFCRWPGICRNFLWMTISFPLPRSRLYTLFRHIFSHWPHDSSFRLVLETWLSFIQVHRLDPDNKVAILTPDITALAVHRQGKTSGSRRHRSPGWLKMAGAVSPVLFLMLGSPYLEIS